MFIKLDRGITEDEYPLSLITRCVRVRAARVCLSESFRYAHLFMHTHRMTIKPVRLTEELEDAVAASPLCITGGECGSARQRGSARKRMRKVETGRKRCREREAEGETLRVTQ